MSNRASLFAIEVSSDQHFYHKLNQIQTVYILLTMANILWMFKQNKKLCKQLFKYLSMHSRYMKPKHYIITFIKQITFQMGKSFIWISVRGPISLCLWLFKRLLALNYWGKKIDETFKELTWLIRIWRQCLYRADEQNL